MKTIKFRACDNVNDTMELNIEHLDSLNEILHKDKYVVMQFINLIDKNEVEIYEGDIVTYKRSIGNWSGKFMTTTHKVIFYRRSKCFCYGIWK